MLDNDVLDMTPGEALLDVPMGEIIERMATAIAEAQVRLDEMSIRIAAMLGETRLDMRQADGSVVSRSLLELGFTPSFYHFTDTTIDVKVSLTIRVAEEFTVRFQLPIGDGGGPGGTTGTTGTTGTAGRTGTTGTTGATGAARGPTGSGGPSPADTTRPTTTSPAATTTLPGGAGQRAAAFGMTLNIEYTRKYAVDSSASSGVIAKLVSVPAPTVFMNELRKSFGIPLGPP